MRLCSPRWGGISLSTPKFKHIWWNMFSAVGSVLRWVRHMWSGGRPPASIFGCIDQYHLFGHILHSASCQIQWPVLNPQPNGPPHNLPHSCHFPPFWGILVFLQLLGLHGGFFLPSTACSLVTCQGPSKPISCPLHSSYPDGLLGTLSPSWIRTLLMTLGPPG